MGLVGGACWGGGDGRRRIVVFYRSAGHRGSRVFILNVFGQETPLGSWDIIGCTFHVDLDDTSFTVAEAPVLVKLPRELITSKPKMPMCLSLTLRLLYSRLDII